MGTETSTSGAGGGVAGSEPIRTGAIVRRGTLGAVVAGVANAVLVRTATAAGIAPGLQPVALPPVLLLTVLGVAGATAVYWLLRRRASNPDRTFVRVAAVVLSLLPDAGLLSADPAATVLGVVVLIAMHVVAAAASVAVLTGRALR